MIDISQLRSLFISALKRANIGKAVADSLEQSINGVASVAFTVGTETSNAITVNVQANDIEGNPVAQVSKLSIGIFADAGGAAFNTTDYSIAAGTDGALVEDVADKKLTVITESDGDADIVITLASGSGSCYLIAFGEGGQIIGTSGEIAHAA